MSCFFPLARLWWFDPCNISWQGSVRVVRHLWYPHNNLASPPYWPAHATRSEVVYHSHRERLFGKKRTSKPPERKMLPVRLRVLAVAATDRIRCSNDDRRLELWRKLLFLRHHLHDGRLRGFVPSTSEVYHHTVHIFGADRHLKSPARSCRNGADQTCNWGLIRKVWNCRNWEDCGESGWGLKLRRKHVTRLLTYAAAA